MLSCSLLLCLRLEWPHRLRGRGQRRAARRPICYLPWNMLRRMAFDSASWRLPSDRRGVRSIRNARLRYSPRSLSEVRDAGWPHRILRRRCMDKPIGVLL